MENKATFATTGLRGCITDERTILPQEPQENTR